MLSAAPTLDVPAEVNLVAGAPLHIALHGSDADHDAIDYTVTTTNSALRTYIPDDNRSLKISVANYGDMVFQLFEDRAPKTTARIIELANQGFYDGLIFHRVIKDFMVQGGGLTAEMHEKAAKPAIKNEAGNGLKNLRGTVAMARTGEVHSATCQFFINTVDNAFLDHKDNTAEGFGYCVFGKVVAGLDVLDAIRAVPTGSRRGHADVPREPIAILSATLLEEK